MKYSPIVNFFKEISRKLNFFSIMPLKNCVNLKKKKIPKTFHSGEGEVTQEKKE